MNERIHEGLYNDYINAKVDLTDAESLLDVGCGPGTFALHFAPKLKEIYAFDFSPKMLEVLEYNAAKRGIKNLKSFCLDLEKEWVGLPRADIIIASRCLEVADVAAVLERLHAQAKRRVYLTFKEGASFLSDEILKVLGREIIPKPDYIYVVNILYQMGIKAKVDFIDPGDDGYRLGDEDSYLHSLTWSQNGLTKEEEERARAYYRDCKKEGKIPAHRNNRWALLSWEK